MMAMVVIILLVSTLMPFMGGVMERGCVTLCQNNLEKISQALATCSSNRGGRRPTDPKWIAAAIVYGSKEILICPKGSYRGGASSLSDISGDMEVIDAPESTAFGDLEDNKVVRMFPERLCYSLPSPVKVDITAPGRYEGDFTSTSKTISAGVEVDSYFLHFDPVRSQNTATGGQVIKFSDEILGIICLDAQLDASDSVLGISNTVYATGQASRGFEVTGFSIEQCELSADRRSFLIHNLAATFPGEQARILTRPGGLASYGVNNKVTPTMTKPDQIYIVEYQRSQVNIDDPKWSAYTAPRHFGRSNALMVNGSVRLLSKEELDRDKGNWRP
jgi:hypothetical protein